MFDSPKWLFFILFGSVFTSLFVGFIDHSVGAVGESKMSALNGLNWLLNPANAFKALTWQYDWLSGELALVSWVFILLNIGFAVLFAYQGYKVFRGY